MIPDISQVLGNWPVTSHGAMAGRVESPCSFSGAAVWRVEADGAAYALRQWQAGVDARQLHRIHEFQIRIATLGPPIIPLLQQTPGGATSVVHGQRFWELATWRPGHADFWQNPTSARLDAAMRTLAEVHNAAEVRPALNPHQLSASEQCIPSPWQRSRSIQRRLQRLESIVGGELDELAGSVMAASPNDARDVAGEAIALITRLAPLELAKARHWSNVDLPLQSRLGDVHHDHVLFTGDEVTGIVDFGAADYDSPAGDVARLLGSLVGDDQAMRRRGLAAYRQVHPLSPDEAAAVDFFDSSGTVVAAANWVRWLWGGEAASTTPQTYTNGLARLRSLATRMRRLAAPGSLP